MLRPALFLLATTLLAQDSPLAHLQEELKSARAQATTERQQSQAQRKETGKWTEDFKGHNAARMERVHAALRSWIESKLPMGPSAEAIKSSDWEAQIKKQLTAAGIAEKEPAPTDEPEPLPFDIGFDAVSVSLIWKPELPEMLFISAGVEVGCGEDDALYGYRFDANGWARVLQDHKPSTNGYGYPRLEFSDPDVLQRRLMLISFTSVQCASTWMGAAYSVFQITNDSATSVFSGEHGFWMGNEDDGLLFDLKPDQLIVELLDASVDVMIHNRTQIHRYAFADGVKRIEPFALQPQDFAEEWLTAPWTEMQSMSAPATQPWHSKLHADFPFGEYSNVAPCEAKPDRWSIGLNLHRIGEQEVKVPLEVHLLVRDLGNYHYSMEAVSDTEFKGCSTEGEPSLAHSWLSKEQLKVLP